MLNAKDFFAFARERHNIFLKRQEGAPFPWTEDPILKEFSFTNVFREFDKTTLWIKEHVRDPLDHPFTKRELLRAIVLARWINRIESLERIVDLFQESDWKVLRAKVKERLEGVSPIVTGAYMIKTPAGMNKLDGILWCMDEFVANHENRILESLDEYLLLEATWEELRKAPFLGDFMAYEIVTDLRHTHLLSIALDIDLWANPGPGCTRGFGVVQKGDPTLYNRHKKSDYSVLVFGMRDLLKLSKDNKYWPVQWKQWELREVEHTLCEYFKYWRAREMHQSPKVRYCCQEATIV